MQMRLFNAAALVEIVPLQRDSSKLGANEVVLFLLQLLFTLCLDGFGRPLSLGGDHSAAAVGDSALHAATLVEIVPACWEFGGDAQLRLLVTQCAMRDGGGFA
jgi:hypothetical protein